MNVHENISLIIFYFFAKSGRGFWLVNFSFFPVLIGSYFHYSAYFSNFHSVSYLVSFSRMKSKKGHTSDSNFSANSARFGILFIQNNSYWQNFDRKVLQTKPGLEVGFLAELSESRELSQSLVSKSYHLR